MKGCIRWYEGILSEGPKRTYVEMLFRCKGKYTNLTCRGPCIVIYILITKLTRCTNFSNLFLEWNSTRFGQMLCPSSGV